MRVVSLAELQAAVGLDEMRVAVRAALVAAAQGGAVLPGVLHLDLGEQLGDLHIKSAWLRDQPTFTVKVAGAFPGAVAAGLPLQQGMSMAFDATTGVPIALFLDGGWLTEVRTGAAGAAAIEHLAPPQVHTLALLGAGSQARHQAQAALRVRPVERVVVWARRQPAAVDLAEELREAHGVEAGAVATVGAAVAGADVVITTTPSRAPILQSGELPDDVVVVAVGADTPGKQELDVAILATAARIVVDDLDQCSTQGEVQHALPAGLQVVDELLVLGEMLARPGGSVPGRTVVDLTGLGVQDAAAAQLAVDALNLTTSH